MNKIEKSNFIRLVGRWKTTGFLKSNHEDQKIVGIDTYELILDGNYIMHHADVSLGKNKSQTIEMITYDRYLDKVVMHYFNSMGQEGRMLSSIIGNECRIEGQNLKFLGHFSDEDTSIKGNWYSQSKVGDWVEYIELILEKQ